nr:transposase [Vibrio sp. ED004]
MDKKALEAFAREAAKSIKTESDLDDFRKMLTKVTVETALNVELDEHLGYEKHSQNPAPTHVMGIPASLLSLMMVKCR